MGGNECWKVNAAQNGLHFYDSNTQHIVRKMSCFYAFSKVYKHHFLHGCYLLWFWEHDDSIQIFKTFRIIIYALYFWLIQNFTAFSKFELPEKIISWMSKIQEMFSLDNNTHKLSTQSFFGMVKSCLPMMHPFWNVHRGKNTMQPKTGCIEYPRTKNYIFPATNFACMPFWSCIVTLLVYPEKNSQPLKIQGKTKNMSLKKLVITKWKNSWK